MWTSIQGSEKAGTRPVAILNGNLLNEHMYVVWVAHLTSKINNYKGNPVIFPETNNGLNEDLKYVYFISDLSPRSDHIYSNDH